MNYIKIILALVILFLAAVGAVALLGLLAATLKYILLFGLVVLAGTVGYKALTRKKRYDPPLLEGDWADRELDEVRRMLDGIRRGELTK